MTAEDQPLRRSARFYISAIVLLAIFGVLILGNVVAFRAFFGLDYFQWYLKNAAAVFLGFAFVSLAWGGLDKHTDLIAAHPAQFLRGYFVLCGGLSLTLSAILRSGRPGLHAIPVLDSLFTVVWSLWLIVAVIVWVIVLGPIQYLLHLVTGAPARTMLDSDLKTWFVLSSTENVLLTAPADTTPPEGAVEAGFYAKPVTLTTTLDSVALFAVNWLVERLAA
jgi:hypothetical protein